MKNHLQNIQRDTEDRWQGRDYDASSANYDGRRNAAGDGRNAADGRRKSAGDKRNAIRRKKRKNRQVYTVLGLTLCLILMVAIMYLCVWLWNRTANPRTEDAMAGAETILYTQQELDQQLAKAKADADQEAELAATQKQDEILNGIRQSLENGTTVVETLRPLYPDQLVLVSNGSFCFVPIKDTIAHNTYDAANLQKLESGEYQYLQNGEVISHKGIDVSKFQGKIDWKKVADDGVEFAIIRVGLRGYGSGKLVEDEYFEDNIKGALSAGLKVGVYIYSQALDETELLEEANFVLEKIAPYKIECPVVYDVEKVANADGRMNNLTVEERTQLTKLFCDTIQAAGYKPMIYHNMEMGVLMVNLEELADYDKWFAYYKDDFYYPYEYKMWQYSEKGHVDGVDGEVDLNISFAPLWEE